MLTTRSSRGGRIGARLRVCVLTLLASGGLSAQQTPTLSVGSLTLHHCETTAPWCGSLSRALDPSGRVPGTIEIYFEFYPHTNRGPSVGTLVATEGGPGYPATESRDEYLDFFQPLRGDRDVLLMDNRGTGRSGAVDCEPLQSAPVLTEANIGRCGESLGAKAALYSATLAADDLAAILEALGAGKVDLYGDSYGTFFEQIFALRHPDRLRSVILDGAYPLDGPDYAWYPNYAPAMRAKFNLACERSLPCSRLPGTSIEHISAALTALRKGPLPATALDADGRSRQFRADATRLAMVMFGSAPAYASVRETDAAARAFVRGDQAPLLRLMAETQVGVDSRDDSQSPARFSEGLAAAVMCEDAPQIFDMSLEPSERVASRDKLIAARRLEAPATYEPFTIDEYRGMPLDYSFIDQCARWPAMDRTRRDSMAKLRTAPYPQVPALVISGDLDNMTPVADGTLVAKRFPRGRQVIVPNGFHVNALAHSRSACPAAIARHFIETLDLGATSCLREIPEVRLIPAFTEHVAEVEPAVAVSGNRADRARLRAVSAAVLTVGDAIARLASNSSGRSVGLRGGTFEIQSGPPLRLTLHELAWTADLKVSGTVTVPGRSGEGSADLSLRGSEANSGSLQVRWSNGVAQARAIIHGVLGGASVAASAPAP